MMAVEQVHAHEPRRFMIASLLAPTAFLITCVGLLWVIAYMMAFMDVAIPMNAFSGVLRISLDSHGKVWLLVVFSAMPFAFCVASLILDKAARRKPRLMFVAATLCLSLFFLF